MAAATALKIQGIPASSSDYLGPARVIDTANGKVTVELEQGTVTPVELAFTLPYQPSVDDVLLIIGRDSRYYAIGVLRGTGRNVLSLQGDVDVRAEGGTLRLHGDKGVEVKGPEVDVEADKIRMIAQSVVQKATSIYQRAKDLLSVRAKQTHTVVDETSFTRAKSASIVTEETMTINGKQIHLG